MSCRRNTWPNQNTGAASRSKVKMYQHTPWRRLGRDEVQLLLLSGQHHASATLYPRGKDNSTHWTGGWMGPKPSTDAEARGKILCPCRKGS
jgi:hypothetical protein